MARLVDKTYGQALFELSVEENRVDEYAEQAAVIRSLLIENPDLVKLLNHPQIDREDKIQVIENCFKGRVADALTGWMVTIVRAGRQADLDKILAWFLQAVRAYRHIGTAYVTSAIALSDAQKRAVEAKLLQITDNVSYEIIYSVDPELIGGMVIRIGDRVVDSSIRSQLETMKKQLMAIQL